MSDDLILNPFAFLSRHSPNGDAWVLTAPKRGAGLRNFSVTRDEEPELFALLTEVSEFGLNSLDIVADLDDRGREILHENGILVAPGEVPERQLFQCLLDSVEPADSYDADDLTVEPSTKFEPFNLVNFRTWIPERNMSPHMATVWVTDPRTDITSGYWLTPEQAEVVAALTPGAPPPPNIGDGLKAKLIGAGILRRAAEGIDITEAVRAASGAFAENKYSVLADIIPRPQVSAMQTFYREYTRQGFMPFGDGQVPRRFVAHNEPLASYFHKQLTDLISRVVGRPVKPTYCYSASYMEGAELEPHTDREQCEYSISFQVDYLPEPENGISPWALYVDSLDHEGPLTEGGLTIGWEGPYEGTKALSKTSVNLANGDGLFYMGRELVHYRTRLPAGHSSTSLFFHYVDADFEGRMT